jgi:dihydroflavonol-4-reductase
MATVLVTGASGFIGQWIARLCPPHHALRILARPNSDLSPLEQSNIRFERVSGDITDPESLSAAMQGVDAIIHAAGQISFNRHDAEKTVAINYRGTRNLFEAALQAEVPKIVYPASIFALGYARHHLVTESSTFTAQEFLDVPYFRAKVAAEQHAYYLIQQGLPLIRLYPGVCLGPGDERHSSNGFIVGWLKGVLPALVNGGICFIDVRDAAVAHWQALERGQIGERYLVPGYNLTHRQLFDQLAQVSGRLAPPFTVPAWMGVLGGTLYERFFAYPPLYRDEARLMAHYWWYDDRRSRQALALTYRPFNETLRDTLAEI